MVEIRGAAVLHAVQQKKYRPTCNLVVRMVTSWLLKQFNFFLSRHISVINHTQPRLQI